MVGDGVWEMECGRDAWGACGELIVQNGADYSRMAFAGVFGGERGGAYVQTNNLAWHCIRCKTQQPGKTGIDLSSIQTKKVKG
jgi:hypothetical protein